MGKRPQLLKDRKAKPSGGGLYFATPKPAESFISSGCKTLDLALGGGWARGRIANIVGDSSTGKTLLCIEACANFHKVLPKGNIYYREREHAFDESYAQALGFPLDVVDFGEPLATVEDMYEDLLYIGGKSKGPVLYIVDSLDALSDRAELARKIDAKTYGADKAAQLSQMFRRLNAELEGKDVTWIVVSQIRDNIGAFFKAKKYKRSGGHALEFYCSQIVLLSNLGKVWQTSHNLKRAVALKVKAMLSKNKIAQPFREAEFEIQFGYGVDDARSCVDWLNTTNFLKDIQLNKDKVKDYLNELEDMDKADFERELADLHKAVETRWMEVEAGFLPKRQKYA